MEGILRHIADQLRGSGETPTAACIKHTGYINCNKNFTCV